MRILGLTSLSHDTGVALLDGGRISAVLEEERHNREKHTMLFPENALRVLFSGSNGLALSDIDVVATPWDPARIRRTFTAAVLGNLPSSLNLIWDASHPTQDSNVIVLNWCLRNGLGRLYPGDRMPPIVNVGHHEAHAAMFFVSPFDDATVVVLDGYGDDAASSVFTGTGNQLTRQWHGGIFDSLGIVYTLVTRHLGYHVFEEGTVMALAALGGDRFDQAMRDVVRLDSGGGFTVNRDYFSHDRYGMLRPLTAKFIETFGPARRRGDPITQHTKDLAHALQAMSEDVILHVVRHARAKYPSRNLVFAGGVALNCVANARLVRESGFDRIWVPPCASDTGAPLGAALYHHHHTCGAERHEQLTHGYHGQAFDNHEIVAALNAAGMAYEYFEDAALIERTARDLADGKIIGWFQGRYEIGPRALGNRSILASPALPGVRDVINARVKFREPFRPFAPSVLAERARDWFEIEQPDPFMTLAPRVRPGMAERIPSAVHVDGTARIQTVERAANPRYHALISAFEALTGVPILINTSFNKQEPVVCRPQEAISCYLRTDIDILVLGNYRSTARPEVAAKQARSSFEVVEVNTRGGD